MECGCAGVCCTFFWMRVEDSLGDEHVAGEVVVRREVVEGGHQVAACKEVTDGPPPASSTWWWKPSCKAVTEGCGPAARLVVGAEVVRGMVGEVGGEVRVVVAGGALDEDIDRNFLMGGWAAALEDGVEKDAEQDVAQGRPRPNLESIRRALSTCRRGRRTGPRSLANS